jgi:large subunit ribosomal protein L21
MSYAIISVGGKQYRVSAGERLLVDRLALEDGASFNPTVLLVGGDGDTQIAPSGPVVTAKVVTQAKGPKIRIGKYKQRTGYKRHTGFRASLTQIEIESIGGAGKSTAKQAAKSKPAPVKDEAPAETPAETPAQAPAGLPGGYADLTVAQVKEAAGGWDDEGLRAALDYEQAHGKRKGAIAALETALQEDD